MDLIPRKFYLDDIFDNFLAESNNQMKCDIYEKEGNYHIEIDIPGYDKKDVNIESKNGYLIVTAKKEKEEKHEDKKYIRREKSYGTFTRSFYVGDINEDEIKAKFNNGVLTIVVPKVKNVENKKVIEIED